MTRPLSLLLVLCLLAPAPAAEPEGQLDALRKADELSRASKWPDAATAWQKITDTNPHLGRAWLNLANARYQEKDYRKSIAAYAKVLELRAGYPFNAAYNIACCHALLGEKEPALEWLQKALDLGFRSLRQVREDDDFKSIRDDDRFKKMAAVVDISKLSRDDGWRFDLDLLVREVKRTHYAPFRKVTREDFDAEVRKLREDIPKLTDNQIRVGFQKLLRRIGDGHTAFASNPHGQASKDRVPAEFYLFDEGLFITAVDERFADLAGAQVIRVGQHTADEVMKALDQVICQDNTMGLKWLGPRVLRSAKVLNGLGLIPDDKAVPLTVRDLKGKEREVSLPADASDPSPAWATARKGATAPEPLYLKNRRTAYWFEHLSAEKLVYFQYNQVGNQGEETFEQFCTRLFRFIESNDVDKLVIDLRWNGGGNNFLNRPLVHGLIRCDKVNQPGKLFVIVGRNTFSAAMCGAADLERHTRAVFVGEPTGSSPNFVGESAVLVEMPYSKLRASVSDLYWQNSVGMDYRTWIAPAIHAPPTFAAYKLNRDPALEAILGRAPEKETPKESEYEVSTVAGTGERGFDGDGGPATKAKLARPCAVAVDKDGNLYIADYGNNRVRKVDRDGTIATLAGTGEAGFDGDGGPATKAKLHGPYGVSVDAKGNVYVSDQRNNRVRRVAPDGVITTVAGNGTRGFAGDGGPATAAALAGPDATVSDGDGNLYIADTGNHRVRKVSPDGTITTIAGTEQGYAGDTLQATKAKISRPASLALDSKGNLYIGDFGNHAVRKVMAQGAITTVAGTGVPGFNGDGLPAVRTQLNEPGGVAVTPDGALLIADGLNFRVRRVGADGLIGTIAGTGQRGFSGDGGPARKAELSVLDILAVDGRGAVYVADHGNNAVRKLTPTR